MADEFLDAIMQRTGDAGFDIQYSNRFARPTLEKLASDVKATQDKIANLNRPKPKKPKTRAEAVSQASRKPTTEEQLFRDYDAARQKLAIFLGETLNTPKGVPDEMAALTGIVDAVSRGRREQSQEKIKQERSAAEDKEFEDRFGVPIPATTEQAPTPTPVEPSKPASVEPTAKVELTPMMGGESQTISSAGERRSDQTETAPQESATSLSDMFGGKEYTPVGAGDNLAPVFTEERKAPELDENRMAQLYRKTTGAEYNPEVSKAAREKMAQLKAFVSTNPEMLNKSDTRIALDFYKSLK